MRRLVIATVTVIAFGIGLGLTLEPARQAEGVELSAHEERSSAPLPSVAIEHEIVVAPLVNGSTPPVPRSRPFVREPARRVTMEAARTTKPESSSLFSRTSRALLGSGRHRPQPFPRINP